MRKPFVSCGLAIGMILLFAAIATAQDDKAKDDAGRENKVLRHAVFFKFKEGTSEADVQKVVDAFRALPAKIEEIAALESGPILAKSGRNDGFTHAFLLTFKDDAGRAAYLPHPEHKAFGDVLRSHLAKVFVIDYWGTPEKTQLTKPLKHAVFFTFKEGTSDDEIKAVEEGLAALPAKIDVVKGLEWGTNNSPEKHDEGITHCFMFTFESEKALKEYADHPDHVAIAKLLLPKVEKVRVIDFYGNAVKDAPNAK
jgi:stress responsive alpha/beta barrel protein